MPTRKKPTFLKRQKELQRVQRATEKREARRARKHATKLGIVADDELETTDLEAPDDGAADASPDDAPETDA